MVVGEFTHETDLIVIGAGPGGYSAAFRAAELGQSVIIADKRASLGGACLHSGCIPSKTLLHIAESIRLHKHASKFGVNYAPPQIDLDAIRAWINQTVEKLGKGLASQARKFNVQCVQATAAFDDTKQISLKGGSIPRVKFRRAVIATGVRAKDHPAFPADDPRIMTPARAIAIESIPQRLLVVGDNPYAIELASIYEALGSKVTLITENAHLIPEADRDLVRPLQRALSNRFEALQTSVKINEVKNEESLHVKFRNAKNEQCMLNFDAAIVAVGVEPCCDELGIDKANINRDENGFITVDEQMLTSNRRVMAVGDITGPPCMADKALAQGRVAGEVAAGWNSALDALAIPVVAFCDPHLAWCGMTEQQAQRQNTPIKIAKIPWGASGRAVGMNVADGLTKIIYEPDTGIVLGVGIVGHGAAEMISEGALAVEMNVELDDLAGTIHPHPSMSELIADAAR